MASEVFSARESSPKALNAIGRARQSAASLQDVYSRVRNGLLGVTGKMESGAGANGRMYVGEHASITSGNDRFEIGIERSRPEYIALYHNNDYVGGYRIEANPYSGTRPMPSFRIAEDIMERIRYTQRSSRFR